MPDRDATDRALARAALVEQLRRSGVLTTARIAAVLTRVPREKFLPEADRGLAYVDDAVMLKRDGQGSPISSVSQPTIVAIMLELLEVGAGQRVLEVGTGSGYNAALLAVLAGAEGEVITVELESDLADSARARLRAMEAGRVRVVCGDGYAGYASGAPYDRIIVTTGAPDVAAAWSDQLASGGRLVVPVVDRAGVGAIMAFSKRGDHLARVAESPCGFLPMRRQSPTT